MTTPARATGRREERTATSRARILDAAVACLVEDGYTGATTLRIQARAGVSRGRLLHHFPSRDQLLVAASRHLAIERIRGTGAERDEIPVELTPGERIDRAVERLWVPFSEPLFWAAVELWTAARTNDDLRAALLPEEREVGAAVRESMAHTFGPDLSAHPQFPLVRDLLFTSMRGVGLGYALDHRDPRTDPHLAQWKQLARMLLDGQDQAMGDAIDPQAEPSGPGCADCDAVGGWWVHLRRCAACGHVGCCDSSPAQHATAHFRATGHPVVQSYEPGEDWFWDYATGSAVGGPPLAPPQQRPLDQAVPGPAGRVPADWRAHIH